MKARRLRAAAAVLALTLAGPAFAQPAPAAPAPAPGPMTMRDPFGDATVSRKDVETQAAARFTALDADKDGSLSPAELAAARPARPGGEARAQRPGGGPRAGAAGGRNRMGDANGDGKVTRDEFLATTVRRFDLMDADHNGQLTKPERQAAMQAMRARMEERMRAMAQSQMGGEGSGSGD